MERSVDSIGTCSLDVDASADLSDWSEISSAGTLRSSASFATPTFPEPHLPSYLSLACTINGYSTTTPYDPVRFAAKSRDASPHRIDTDLTTTTTYSAQNNLLSPPNLVPLPLKMEKALAQQHLHGEFYASMSTKKYISKETFTSSLFAGIGMDATDGCVDTGRRNAHTKCVSYESKTVTAVNGQSKCVSETSVGRQYENGQETKSFIQQRVERLYGPGALAQGFFKPQKKRVSEGEDKASSAELRIMSEDLEPAMRQSTSSPTLPVLRHLRPEFRAQLPFISPKKGVAEGAMQKSVTAPALKEKGKVNGCVATQLEGPKKEETNGLRVEAEIEHETERDGHYFLRVLDVQSKRLLELATKVENYMTTPNLSEEVIGILRAASGKGRLLVMQKMQQFKGLCTNNINRTEDEQYPTTNEDLQGFWDMVMLQVDQVDAIFRDVEALKVNGWKEVAAPAPELAAPSSASNPRRAAVRPRSAASEETRKQREAQRRKIIEDRRKAMKNAQQLQQKEKEPSIEIFAPNPAS